MLIDLVSRVLDPYRARQGYRSCRGCSLMINAKVLLVHETDSGRWVWGRARKIECARICDHALRAQALSLEIDAFMVAPKIELNGLIYGLLGIHEGRYCSVACRERHGGTKSPRELKARMW